MALLQTVQNELHAARDAQLFEDAEQIVAHDLPLARGWTARRVALICYALTGGLVIAGWIVLRAGFPETLVATVLIVGGLLATAVPLGSLRSEDRSRNKTAEARLEWREMPDRRQRQKI